MQNCVHCKTCDPARKMPIGAA
ncbi:MAG: hypothetical protein WBW81_11640 [Methylocella sp.]